MQLAQKDQQRMGYLSDAVAFLPDLLSRYASIERNYGDRSIDDWNGLQQAIVRVYAAVLKYANEVKLAQEADISGW